MFKTVGFIAELIFDSVVAAIKSGPGMPDLNDKKYKDTLSDDIAALSKEIDIVILSLKQLKRDGSEINVNTFMSMLRTKQHTMSTVTHWENTRNYVAYIKDIIYKENQRLTKK